MLTEELELSPKSARTRSRALNNVLKIIPNVKLRSRYQDFTWLGQCALRSRLHTESKNLKSIRIRADEPKKIAKNKNRIFQEKILSPKVSLDLEIFYFLPPPLYKEKFLSPKILDLEIFLGFLPPSHKKIIK